MTAFGTERWRLFALGGRGDHPQRRRVVIYLVGLVGVVFYTVGYRVAMVTFENQFVTFPEALLAVVQSFTTTGYGEQADQWTTAEMQLLMVSMEVTDVALIFLALPVFLAPWVEERLSTRAPTSVDLSGHVVICGFTSRGEALVDELDARKIPHVVEPDYDLANELFAETDYTVVHGDPEEEDDPRAAGAGRARAIVADVDQEANASVALATVAGRMLASTILDEDIGEFAALVEA